MASVTLSEVEEYARAVAGPAHDADSSVALKRALDEHRMERLEPLAPVRFTIDGRPYPSIFPALADPSVLFSEVEITVLDPPPAGPAWEWSRPVRDIRLASDGSAEVAGLDGEAPLRTIARILSRDAYRPNVPSSPDAPRPGRSSRPGLLAVGPAVEALRRSAVVPFGVALLLYGPDERYRLEFDLIDSTLVRDPRSGRLPVARRVRRTSRVSHEVDRFLARGELSVRTARVLEALVESHGLTPFEVSQIFGGVREVGISTLRVLASRGLATLDRQTGVYRPRFSVYRPDSERRAPVRGAPVQNPALRTSVMELLAAADSRATCPLCGDPMPAGPRGMLCARCQAEVGAASDTAPL